MAGSPTIEQIITLLEAQPRRIAGLTAGLLPAQLHNRPGPDEWSLNEILAHLRSCADVWGDCIRTIVTGDPPIIIRATNPRTWARSTNYHETAFRPSFEAFTGQRAELLAFLRKLTPDQWELTATVTGAGKPLERTPRFYAQWLAEHERSHIKYIERMVKPMG